MSKEEKEIAWSMARPLDIGIVNRCRIAAQFRKKFAARDPQLSNTPEFYLPVWSGLL